MGELFAWDACRYPRMKMRKPMACALDDSGKLLGVRRCALGGGVAGENGVVAAESTAGENDGEANGGEHENDRGIGRELGKEIGCSAGAEGGLRSLAPEGAGEVCGFALLEEDDANEKERDDDVDDKDEIEHGAAL